MYKMQLEKEDKKMRIENITVEKISQVEIKELKNLRGRFIQIYIKKFKGNAKARSGNLFRNYFLTNYKILLNEMKKRDLPYLTFTELDRIAMRKTLLGIDVASLGDVAVVNDYISISGSYIKSPKDAKDVDIIIREKEENRDEALELKISRLIKGEVDKDPHFVYSPAGPNSSYIPLWDKVLRTKTETKKIAVKESIEKIAQAFGSPQGQKRKSKIFIKYFPVHNTYVEPFIGGGSILFRKKESSKEIINDVVPEISFAYKFIKNITVEKIKKLKAKSWIASKAMFDKLKKQTPKTDIEMFYKFIYINRFSWGRLGRVFMNLEEGNKSGLVERLDSIKERLKKVIILNGDFKETKKYDSKDTFYYLDPPYTATNLSINEPHITAKELHDFCKGLKGKFLISLNGSKEHKELFKKYHIKTVRTRRQLPDLGATSPPRNDLIISNFPLKESDLFMSKGLTFLSKELTEKEEKECEEETEKIRENSKTAKFPHKFKSAKYTFKNGHPRCLICGDEERIGGICKLEKGEHELNLESFEYLTHHIALEDDEEIVHHCLMMDHIANTFEQAHLWIDNGKVYLDGKEIKEGYFHVIKGLEPTQEVSWSETEAEKSGIKPKRLGYGATLKKKAKVW